MPGVACEAKTTESLSDWIPAAVLAAPDGTELVTVTLSNGQVWMDRNLGASRVATSPTDYEAYGSLYQWCRAADGHQLISWESSTAGTGENGTTTTLATNVEDAGHSQFIINNSSSYSWMDVALEDATAWWYNSQQGVNNPCPDGFHVPTQTELTTLASWLLSNSEQNNDYSTLKLCFAGVRQATDGSISVAGTEGRLWSSTVTEMYTNIWMAYFIKIKDSAIEYSNLASTESYGLSIRCLQNE